MRIVIFGASGGTGRQLLSQGLNLNLELTAFVRDPGSLTIKNKKLFIFKGDVLDIQSVQKAIKNQDVVISVLGNKTSRAFWKQNTIISQGVKNIIRAMKKNKVKRLLFVSSFGLNKKIFLLEKLFIRIVLRNIFSDIPKQEELIKQSSLDWTIIHPARLTNGPKTGIYKSGDLAIGLFSKISRADTADFLLKITNLPETVKKTLTISY